MMVGLTDYAICAAANADTDAFFPDFFLLTPVLYQDLAHISSGRIGG